MTSPQSCETLRNVTCPQGTLLVIEALKIRDLNHDRQMLSQRSPGNPLALEREGWALANRSRLLQQQRLNVANAPANARQTTGELTPPESGSHPGFLPASLFGEDGA